MKKRNDLIKKLIYLSTYRGKHENEQLLKNLSLLFDSSVYNELELMHDFLNENDDDIFRWLTVPSTSSPKYIIIINKILKLHE